MSCGIIILFASRYSVKLRQKLDRLNQLFLESLEGVRVIRAFNKQQAERRRFGEANTDYAATAMLSGRITSLLLPVINVIFGVTTAAVLGLGARYVETGAMEVGSLVANSQYISMVLMSVMMLALVIMMFPTAYALRGAHCRNVTNRNKHPGTARFHCGAPSSFYSRISSCDLCLPREHRSRF